MRTTTKKVAAKPAAKKKMAVGGMAMSMSTLDKGKKKKKDSRDPLGSNASCKSGKCGPMAGINKNKLARQRSASASAFSKPKLKRTKVRF